MKFLIVGAGAVGQPLGYHARAGGATVEFLVKPQYVDTYRRHGMTLVRVPWLRRLGLQPTTHAFRDFNLHGTFESVAASARVTPFDAVFITIAASDLFGARAWVDSLRRAVGESTPLILMTIGITDRAFLVETCGVPDRLVHSSAITWISWQCPVPGERWPPLPTGASAVTPAAGADEEDDAAARHSKPVAYLLQGAYPIAGDKAVVEPIARALTAGGLPTSHVANAQLETIATTAAGFMTLLVLVEACNWSYSAALFSGHLWLTTRAGAEAMVAATAINKRPWLRHLWIALLPLFLFVLALGPLIAPFDLERYFAYHFGKVGPQTKLYIDEYIRVYEATTPLSAADGTRTGKPRGAALALRKLTTLNDRWRQPSLAADAADVARVAGGDTHAAC